ncbi:S-layer homology domain-containing protein [Syntrophomonas curvata]
MKKRSINKVLPLLTFIFLLAFAAGTASVSAELPPGSAKAWLATDGRRPADDGNGTVSYSSDRAPLSGRLDLAVNVEQVHFTGAIFEIQYDGTLVGDPIFNDPQRSDLNGRNIDYTVLNNGWKKATVTLTGNVIIGDTGNYDIGNITTHPTLFELAFSPTKEGTMPLGFWQKANLPNDYATCSLQLTDGGQPIQLAAKPSNDDLVLFTFTDKSQVSYYFDYNSGKPLIDGSAYSVTNEGRTPMPVIPDSHGGYFFNSSPGASYDWECPGYPLQTGNDSPAAFHAVHWISPNMLAAEPHQMASTTDDVSFTVNSNGIGAAFDANKFSFKIYTAAGNGQSNEITGKTASFTAIDDNNIRMTLTGGLQALGNNPVQLYNIYLFRDTVFVGRVYCSVGSLQGEALQILSRSPGQGCSEIPLQARVDIKFSANLNAATVNPAAITVTKADGSPVEGGYNLSLAEGDSALVKINFPQGLKVHTSYTVTVGTGVKDGNGKALAAQESWNFSTVSDAVPNTPFRVEVLNGNGQWMPGSNLTDASMGVYYYFRNQNIQIRLIPKNGANLPTPVSGYQLLADISSINPGPPVPLNWDAGGRFWTLTYQIPEGFTTAGPCPIMIMNNINGQQPALAAIMMAVININPKDFGIGLGGETTDWSTVKDFTRIHGLIFEKYDNINPQKKIARLALGNPEKSINACELDASANPITATAMQRLQQNLDIAYGKMSINTAADALASFNKPATLTLYHIDSAIAPGVKYWPSSGESVVLIPAGATNPVDPTGRINSYNWDAVQRSLTLQVSGWSGYEVIPGGALQSANAELKGISASAGTLAPAFDSSITSYSVALASDYTGGIPTITATKADPEATVVVTPASSLSGTEAERTAVISVTAQNGITRKIYRITFVNKEVIPGIKIDGSTTNVSVSAANQNFEVPVIAPADINNVTLAFNVPKEADRPTVTFPTQSGAGNTIQAIVPRLEIEATRPVGGVDQQIALSVPAGTTVTGPAGWDGTLALPTVKTQPSTSISGTATVVLEVGIGDTALSFDKAVRLLLPGQAGKAAGFVRNGVFIPISRTLTADTQAAADSTLQAGQEAKIDSGSSLAIWTKHFTEFVCYTPTPAAVSGGGGGTAAPSGILVGKNGATVNEAGVSIVIPASAVSSDIRVKVEKVSKTGLPVPANSELISDVVDISKDKPGNFDRAVTIILSFDKNKAGTGKYDLALFYFDAGKNQWIKLDNVKTDLDAGKVSGEVKHFTRFAIIATAKESAGPKAAATEAALSDIAGHWAEASIRQLVAADAVKGYPDARFRPDNSISRAEFATVLVKAFKLEPGTGKVFADINRHWAKDYIATANAHSIVNGYDAARFGPDDLITREQMALMIVRAAGLSRSGAASRAFNDQDSISSWALEPVAAAVSHGVISGYPDNSFKPRAAATRAEAASLIIRALHAEQ